MSALILLGGCTALPTADSTVPPVATTSPSPTPTPGAGAPASSFDTTCSDLVDPAELASAYSTAVAERDPAISQSGASLVIPEAYYVRAASGITCEWSNGEAYTASTGSNPSYVGIRVEAITDAASQWERSGGANSTCPEENLGCSITVYAAGTWIEVAAEGAVSNAAASSLALLIAGRLQETGTGAVAPGSPSLPDLCSGLLDAADVSDALGVVVSAYAGEGPWGLSYAAADRTGSGPWCSWYDAEDVPTAAVTLRAMPGGVWAWNELAAIASPEPRAITVDGSAAGDGAWVRCPALERAAGCVVDLIHGGDWIQISGDSVGSDDAQTRRALTTLAGNVLSRL